MSVEIDGDVLPPNVINNLEIFMLNVLRFKSMPDDTDLIEKPEEKAVILDRKIIVDHVSLPEEPAKEPAEARH